MNHTEMLNQYLLTIALIKYFSVYILKRQNALSKKMSTVILKCVILVMLKTLTIFEKKTVSNTPKSNQIFHYTPVIRRSV